MDVRFYDKAIETGRGADGLPVFGLATFVSIDRDAVTKINRKARPEDIQRFAVEYAAYKAGAAEVQDGFPLEAFPGVNPAERETLIARGIRTVERLADVSMDGAPTDMRDAQDRAKKFLVITRADAPKMAAKITALEGEKAALVEQVRELADDNKRLASKLAKEAKAAKVDGAE
jgi:hypothetical protein